MDQVMIDLGMVDHPELALPSIAEAFSAFRDLSPSDVAVLTGGAVWLLIISLKLVGIDRRDVAAGFGYMLFASAAGVALILAVPKKLTSGVDAFDWIFLIGALSVLSALRWFPNARVRVQIASVAANAKKKG